MSDIPAITGVQLIKLLEKDGWIVKRKANHGTRICKKFEDRTVVTVVPHKKKSLPKGTLNDILSQVRLSPKDLSKLVSRCCQEYK